MAGKTGAYPKNLNRQIHGLRGFAALAVFVFHIYGMASVWGFWPAMFEPLDDVFIVGRHGVEIFFIVSGYLITGSLIRHRSAGKFLIDRAIRIYPVFMTIQLLVFALGPVFRYRWFDGIGPLAWVKAFIANGLFLPGLLDMPLAQLNAWSLSYEAAFYLVSAAVFIGGKIAGRWLVAIILALLLVYICMAYPKAIFFPVGAAVYFIIRLSPVRLPGCIGVLSLPAFIATLALLTMAEFWPWLVFAATVPALMFFWAAVEGRGLLSSMLRLPFLQYMGTISYSFYLWSPVVTYPMKLFIQHYMHGLLNDIVILALFAVIGFAASIAVAQISFTILEGRVGRFLRGP
jgi:peptidoglycan/LPS O-acetylase OafA/YrhL